MNNFIPWNNHKELIQIIEFIKNTINFENEWIWTKNPSCKYIDIRIDMRDGNFILKDRNGNRITFDEFKKQI